MDRITMIQEYGVGHIPQSHIIPAGKFSGTVLYQQGAPRVKRHGRRLIVWGQPGGNRKAIAEPTEEMQKEQLLPFVHYRKKDASGPFTGRWHKGVLSIQVFLYHPQVFPDPIGLRFGIAGFFPHSLRQGIQAGPHGCFPGPLQIHSFQEGIERVPPRYKEFVIENIDRVGRRNRFGLPKGVADPFIGDRWRQWSCSGRRAGLKCQHHETHRASQRHHRTCDEIPLHPCKSTAIPLAKIRQPSAGHLTLIGNFY